MRCWPPRLSDQPIFYPVLTLSYATQIASSWNVQSPPFAGYVTQFAVSEPYASRFERHVVGGRQHEELWVPAEELAEFNHHLINRIEVVEAFFGPKFVGLVPEHGGFRGRGAHAQLQVLASQYSYSLQDFSGELSQNHAAVFLHYPFWSSLEPEAAGVPGLDRLLAAIREHRERAFPELPLPAISRSA
jgi:hypothetical protein